MFWSIGLMTSVVTYFILISLISQCWLVDSTAPMLNVFRRKASNIRLSELAEEFRKEPADVFRSHVTLMAMVASYGANLYSLDQSLDGNCFKIVGATWLMTQKLATCAEANKYIDEGIDAVAREFQVKKFAIDHPLVSFCRNVEKNFADNSNLSALFEKAKKDVTFDINTRCPPYSSAILRSEDSMMSLLIDWLDVPELAKQVVHASFQEAIDGYTELPLRMYFFAESCQAVAKNPRFAVSMQSIYEKTINSIVPEITAHNRRIKFEYSFDSQS